MRKWTYLVAALLMAGTTATFTGCIDTDEPEGIVNLRGAKAELIKAEASVKLVEVEMGKAQVAQMELQNKALELQNKNAEYANELKALEVKQKELELELQQAKNEVEKAKLQNEIAQANADKEAIENAKALAAEAFKSQMLVAQTATANAQAAYEQAIKDLELAKLTLSASEQQKITIAQNFLTSASVVMNQKYTALNTAQTNYYNALVNPNLPTLGKLQAELAYAQVEVEKAEIMLDKQSETLALVEDFDAATWDKKKTDYKKQISEYESEKAKTDLKETEIKNSAEYKAADKKVTDAGKLTIEANVKYNGGVTSTGTIRGAKSDSLNAMAGTPVNGVATRLAIKRYTSEEINPSLKELFNRLNPFATSSGYNVNTGVFSYASGIYAQGAYLADDEDQSITDPWIRVNAVNSWIGALEKYSVDGNGVAWGEIGLKQAEKDAATAKTNFDAAKNAWEIIVKAVKDGKATTVPTSVKDRWDLQEIVTAYNTDYKALADAITAYNTEYDSKYKTAYDASIDKWKADEKKTIEFDLMYAVISGKQNLLSAYTSFLPTTGTITIDIKINTAKTVLNNLNAGVGIPGAGAISDELDVRYTANKVSIETTAKGKGLAAVATLSNAKITAADTKVKADIAPLTTAMSGYISLASYPYVQLPVNALNIGDLTGAGNFYETKTETDGKVHYVVLRKSISTTGDNNDYAKFTATKLKSSAALTTDLGTASNLAFGNQIPTAGEPQRLTEVTEEMVREHATANSLPINSYGQLGRWMYAKDQVQYYKDLVNAKDLILTLKTQIEGVLADLQAEIQSNSEKIQVYVEKANDARIALGAAQTAELAAVDERDALLAEVNADKQKFTELIADMNALITTVDSQIASIANGTSGLSSVAEVIAYWKEQVTIAGKTVETKKQEQAAKEKAIKLFNDGEYTEAYALAQKKAALDSATDEYTTAKTVYDMALSQLKALITALTK